MRCYKVKVRHKRLEDIEAWFYLIGDPKEELANLTEASLTTNLSYYPIRKSLIEINEQECLELYKTNVFYENINHMTNPAYIELKKPFITDPPRLTILKRRYNRIAVRLNGFFELLSEEEIKNAQTQLKYYQGQIDSYE